MKAVPCNSVTLPSIEFMYISERGMTGMHLPSALGSKKSSQGKHLSEDTEKAFDHTHRTT